MSSYDADAERRRYSGYDEYEGIFGPLGTGHLAPRHGRRVSYGRRDPHVRSVPGYRARSASAMQGSYAQREAFLRERRSKRAQAAGLGAMEDIAPSAPLQKPKEQQIWLPTRTFSFRQRAGKLDTRAIARVDLEKIVATTDIDTIQRHLENLAFSDVTLEDVQQYSDAYFFKLFQIAQLTLEYLLNVQESLVSHCENLEAQCESLVQECHSLETENEKIDAEVVGLKKAIRQKQSTLATFEMLLLNSSNARRSVRATPTTKLDGENDPAVLNVLGDEVPPSSNTDERGAIEATANCVICGKKFISAEYLVRHQQKKHRGEHAETHKKRSKRSRRSHWRSDSSQSASDSDRDSVGGSGKEKHSKRSPQTAPLPAEVSQALLERNELTKQLLAMQTQLQLEKERRDEQTRHAEQQQLQLTAQVTTFMSRLQDMLVNMEKKQEQTKHEMMRYTQEAVDRLRTEAITSAKAKMVASTTQRKSHAGDLESDADDGGDEHRREKHPTAAREDKLEKMLDAFLRAQTEKQHEIDQLAQENKKLLHKQARLRKQQYRTQHATALEPSLLTMAALEAQRFGVDLGAPTPAVVPPSRKVSLEDKPIQTDTNEDLPKVKPVPAVVMATHEVQTEPEPVVKEVPRTPALKEQRKASFVKPEPIKIPPMPEPEVISIVPEPKTPKPIPPAAEPSPVEKQEAKQEALSSHDANARLQHAAHLVGKVALGFLTRKALKNPRNWNIVLSAEALRNALSEQERDAFLRLQGQSTLQDVEVEVEPHMTANELRLAIAECLCGHVQSTDDDAHNPSFDFHRVLLYDRRTHEELRGDQELHSHRHQIDVEIIPFFDEAERHVSDLFELHTAVNEQLQDLRRASATFTLDELRALRGVDEEQLGDNTSKLFRVTVRIQSSIRRFLARRQLQMLKVERLIDARLLGMETSRLRALSQDSRRQSSLRGRSLSVPEQIGSVPLLDTEEDRRQVSERTLHVHNRLADLVRQKTGINTRSRSTKWLHGQLPTEEYERQLEELQSNREKMSVEIQQRIHHILEHVESLVEREYDPARAAMEENEFHAARKIQNVVQVALARRRLKQLLGQHTEQSGCAVQINQAAREDPDVKETKQQASDEAVESKTPHAGDDNESEERKDVDDIEDLDDTEIARLADAYEHAATHQEEEEEKGEKCDSPKSTERVERNSPPPQGSEQSSARPGTPTPDTTGRRAGTPVPADEGPTHAPGRSPRPKEVVISPFSKTPLISRRASLTRRGSGYDNAR